MNANSAYWFLYRKVNAHTKVLSNLSIDNMPSIYRI